MNALQCLLVTAVLCVISRASSEDTVARVYLPAGIPVDQRKLFLFPQCNKYQQTYYPQSTQYQQTYYPQYNSGLLGGYQQQTSGQQLTSGTSLGLNGLSLSSLFPNVNVDLVASLTPNANTLNTAAGAHGGYVYGKKK